MSAQLAFDLKLANPLAHRYFVAHSGVIQAVQALEQALAELRLDQQHFVSLYVFGAESTGKSHLLTAYQERALELGLENSCFLDLSSLDQVREGGELEGSVVSSYDALCSGGGLFLAVGAFSPQSNELSPHVRSRLLAGRVFELAMPQESELRPVLLSMMERKNLRISDFSLNYLLKRLPRNPLSFGVIFAKIHQLCFGDGRPANWSAVREVVDLLD